MGTRLWMTSRLGLIVIMFFLDAGILVHSQLVMDDLDIFAIDAIRKAWQDTPDMSRNLAHWDSNSSNLCMYLNRTANATMYPSWKGVECMSICANSTLDPDCTLTIARIVALSLSNASIVGVLPLEIGYLSMLSSLKLTGNPNLTGPLPEELQYAWINELDVHDNGFNGKIPSWPYLWNILRLDLSGNQFAGDYPFEQLGAMDYLQELGIADNLLYGEIRNDAFTNKTELTRLDISDNSFNGTLPNLTFMPQLTYLDVSGNSFTGSLPNIRGPFSILEYVNLAGNRFSGPLNLEDVFNLSISTSLVTVNLSHNQLSGPLPLWNASSLGSIRELYLDNNNLSEILNISQMFAVLPTNASTTKLKLMSLINNSITDVISDPDIIANVQTTIFRLQGNPYCNNTHANKDAQRCYCSQICFVSITEADSRKVVVIATTTSVTAVLLISLIVVWGVHLRNKRYKQYLQLEFEQKFEKLDVKPTIFTYSELRDATRGFHEDMKLGEGGYGAVYKGVLPSGQVAIKKLFKTAKAHDEFLNEVVLITGMKHRNLVSLKGCCLREPQRFLVYEYVDNYDVDQVLLGSRKEEMRDRLASWPIRQKICLGIAHGLHYLHAMAHPRVIHRDIKAGNVLLNSRLEAKIADFGLALLFPDEQSRIVTINVAGTKGYVAPEYLIDGELSDKVDVYSFGVLCLEIISGRRNIDGSAPKEQVSLCKWVWKLHEEDKLMDLLDPSLEVIGEEVKDVQRFLIMCLQCISFLREKRPSMARIVSILQGDTDTESHMHVLEDVRPSSSLLQSSRNSRSELYSLREDGGNNTSSLTSLSWHPRHGHSSGDGNMSLQMSTTVGR